MNNNPMKGSNRKQTISDKEFAIKMLDQWEGKPVPEEIRDVFETVLEQTGSWNSFRCVLPELVKLNQERRKEYLPTQSGMKTVTAAHPSEVHKLRKDLKALVKRVEKLEGK